MIFKLKEAFAKIFNKQQFYEMSKAFSYKDRRIDVCVWVENPMGVDNMYFKYYDCSLYTMANKVARIRLDKPKYVGGNHKEGTKKKWVLSERDKKELVELLKSPSDEHEGLTKWQDVIITYNDDNFNLKAKQTINGELDKAQRDPKMPSHLVPLPIDLPMPNYLEL